MIWFTPKSYLNRCNVHDVLRLGNAVHVLVPYVRCLFNEVKALANYSLWLVKDMNSSLPFIATLTDYSIQVPHNGMHLVSYLGSITPYLASTTHYVHRSSVLKAHNGLLPLYNAIILEHNVISKSHNVITLEHNVMIDLHNALMHEHNVMMDLHHGLWREYNVIRDIRSEIRNEDNAGRSFGKQIRMQRWRGFKPRQRSRDDDNGANNWRNTPPKSMFGAKASVKEDCHPEELPLCHPEERRI